MDARSAELLEFPRVRARLAAYAAFAPSRRLALALEPSGDPVVVARRLDETDEARWLLSVRPDVGIGGARDIGPGVARAARGGRLEPGELLAIVETLVAAGRLADALRRAGAAAAPRAVPRASSRCPSLRARLEASVDPAGEILDTRLAGARWPAPRRAASPTSGCAAAWRRSSTADARERAPGAPRHAAQRPLRRSRCARTPRAGQGHRPRPVGQRPDALHRAARRRRARQRLARGPAGGPGGGGAHPRRALGARRRRRRRRSRETSTPWPASTSGLCRARLADGAGRRPRRRPARERQHHPAVGAPPRPAGPVVPIDVRLGGDYTALVITGPEHRRQDGGPAHRRPARAHAPVGPARARRRRQRAADLPRRARRHRRRAVRGPVAVHLQRPPAHHHAHRGRWPGEGMPRAARRAGRRHGPDRGLGARPGAPRPLHPRRARSSWRRRTTPS